MQKELAGIKILIVRKTYQELMNNHINDLRGMLYGIAKYNGSEKIFRFPNGSTIKFDYCAADGDVDHYQGVEYDVIFLDEAGQLREEWIKKIIASMRGANNLPKRTYFTLNPGGPSHGYFKRIYVDRAFNENENPDDYAFIQSKVYDNIILMKSQPDYIQQLKALPSKLREAWLEGNWNMFVGQYFEEFVDDPDHYDDWQWTHVINPFEPKREWGDIYRSYDEGYNVPFCVQWFVVSPDGVMFMIMELYGCTDQPNEGVKWTNDEIFARVAEIERTHPWFKGRTVHGVADPSCWAGGDRGISSMDMAAKYGLHFKKGDNARVPGWMQVRYRLQFDKNGYSRLYIFKTCKAMIRTIQLQMFDDKKPDDLDSSLEDHACVVGSTRIYTPDGHRDISEGILPSILAHDLRYHPIIAGGMTAQKADVYTVTCEDGRSLTATANHPFLLADGVWKRLDELREGDELMDAAEVKVISSTIQEFMGERFYKCGSYFQHKGKRLHRAVWSFANGPVPKGYDVHHIDGDRHNNNINNLLLMPEGDHAKAHMTPERRKASSERIGVAIEAAKAWHATPEGRAWHAKHAKDAWANKDKRKYECSNCGEAFETTNRYGPDENRFCSNACKSAYRRKLGVDNVMRACERCGRVRVVNKYNTARVCSRWCKG